MANTKNVTLAVLALLIVDTLRDPQWEDLKVPELMAILGLADKHESKVRKVLKSLTSAGILVVVPESGAWKLA